MALTPDQITKIRAAAGAPPLAPGGAPQRSLVDVLNDKMGTNSPGQEPALQASADSATTEADQQSSPLAIAKDTVKNVGDTLLSGTKATGENIGQTIATPEVTQNLNEANTGVADMQLKVLKQIQADKAAGKDTTHLQNAYNSITAHGTLTGAEGILPALNKSNLQVLIDGASAGAEALSGTGIGPAKTAVEAVAKPAIDAVDTAVQGAKDAKVAARSAKSTQTAIDNVTPNPAHFTSGERDALDPRKIIPKTLTQPEKYSMSPEEVAIATKNKEFLQAKDPAENSINLMNNINKQDKQVEQFLKENNTPIDPAKMKAYLTEKMADITDITVPEERLNKSKQTMINNFVDSLKEKDVVAAWSSRKSFDSSIEKAFKGSPTLAKDMKIGLRNGVQDFIAENTPEGVYSSAMRSMSEQYKLNDILTTKAQAEKGKNAIQAWIKANPTKAKAIGVGTSLVGGDVLWNLMH